MSREQRSHELCACEIGQDRQAASIWAAKNGCPDLVLSLRPRIGLSMRKCISLSKRTRDRRAYLPRVHQQILGGHQPTSCLLKYILHEQDVQP